MNVYKIAITDFPGWSWLGYVATRNGSDFLGDGLRLSNKHFLTTSRKEADAKAQECADWVAQFEDTRGYLVVRKTPRKGWVVVAQF